MGRKKEKQKVVFQNQRTFRKKKKTLFRALLFIKQITIIFMNRKKGLILKNLLDL